MNEAKQATITVQRPSGLIRDSHATYTVEIDGEKAGRLTAGDELQRSVASGEHKVSVSVGATQRQEVAVALESGEAVTVTVRPRGRMFGFWRALSGGDWLELSVTPQ